MGRALLRRQKLEPGGATPQADAVSAPKSGNALGVWGGFALLMLLVTVPLASTVLPPLFDYPNHLARMHLLQEGGNAFYEVHWRPLPNLAQDLIVPLLAQLMPLGTASKLFLVMILGALSGSAIWLNRLATGAWRFWPLLTFLLLYNRVFLWGFVNYLFGIGAAFAGIACWLALERKPWPHRVLVSSIAALAGYFSHLAAFGFYGLVIIGIELPSAFGELRSPRWAALAKRAAIAGAQFILPAAMLLLYWRRGAGGVISYAGLWRKADLVFSVFDNYDRVFDIASFALFLLLIGWLAATRRLGLTPRLRPALCLVFAAYLFLPSQIYGTSGVDHRLPAALLLLLVASCAPRFSNRRIAIAVAVAAGSLLVVRMALIEYIWLRADQVYSADLSGIDMLPRGAKLAVAYRASAINFAPVPEVHVPLLAIARREAFVPTLFAYPEQQPVALRPAYLPLAEAAQPELLWAAFVGSNVAGSEHAMTVLQHYDHIAFIDRQPLQVPPHRCLEPVFVRPTFQIFTIRRMAGCGGAAG